MPPFYQGIAYALAAGLLWGLVFVTPLWLHDYPGMLLSFARYLAFGLISIIPAYFARRTLRSFTRSHWQVAFMLGLVGNIIYYGFLATAIQLAGAPLPTVLIGTLPLVIAMCSNFSNMHAPVPWMRLLCPLLLILLGLACVNAEDLRSIFNSNAQLGQQSNYLLGAACAVCAVAAWTWYPIKNASFLQNNPDVSYSHWATAQGLATLPLAILGYLAYWLYASLDGYATSAAFSFPLGATPLKFIALMLMLGLLASWLGTLCWNRASQLLPTALAGQLIVFETLAALAYGMMHQGVWPQPLVMLGIAVLIAGVLMGVRVFQKPS